MKLIRKNGFLICLVAWLPIASLAQSAAPTLAIADFENSTGVFSNDLLGKTIPEMLKTELASLGHITVLERSKMEAVLNEQALAQTGVIDTMQAQRVGQLLGAEFVLTGELSYIGNRFRIDTHIVRVATGEVTGEKVSGPNEKAVEKMIQVLARNIDFNLTGQGMRLVTFPVRKYYYSYVLAAGGGTALLSAIFHSSYRKNFQSYESAERLNEFDDYFDKANASYKARNATLVATAALVTTGLVLWWQQKNEKNQVFARGARTPESRFALRPCFDVRTNLFTLQLVIRK